MLSPPPHARASHLCLAKHSVGESQALALDVLLTRCQPPLKLLQLHGGEGRGGEWSGVEVQQGLQGPVKVSQLAAAGAAGGRMQEEPSHRGAARALKGPWPRAQPARLGEHLLRFQPGSPGPPACCPWRAPTLDSSLARTLSSDWEGRFWPRVAMPNTFFPGGSGHVARAERTAQIEEQKADGVLGQ